jgi:microcystin-dependent protein
MAFVRPRARIGQRSTTSGSGPWTLASAFDTSYNTFASFMSDGDRTYASIVEPGVAFATGVVTYAASGGTLALTDVEETKGTFGAGTKEIFAGALASTSMFREDIAGAIVTGGTSTAYTVSSHRVYDTLAHLDGNIIAFTPHATNGIGGVTLSIDGLTAKPLRTAPSTELLQGVLIQGTPYLALYNNTDGAFYLHSFFGNPLSIPLGFTLNGYASSVPNSYFAIPNGQAISRSTYAGLFSLLGTTYGSGNGTTTFNIPDETGCVEAMQEASATRLTSNGWGGDSTTVGSRSGVDSVGLVAGQIPTLTSTGNNSIIVTGPNGHTSPQDAVLLGSNGFVLGSAGPAWTNGGAANNMQYSGTNSISVSTSGTSGSVHKNVQPTMIKFRAMRVL